jgi:hypothetical protein
MAGWLAAGATSIEVGKDHIFWPKKAGLASVHLDEIH